MKYCKKGLFTTLLFTLLMVGGQSLVASNSIWADQNTPQTQRIEPQEDTMTIVIEINGTTYSKLEKVSKTGYLQVYNIMGQEVTRIKLSDCEGGCSLSLARGIYILKAGKVAQKIVAR